MIELEGSEATMGDAGVNVGEVRAFFDRMADGWDGVCEHDPARIERILDLADILPGVSVLDIACGTGVLVPYYLRRGVARVHGIDLSAEMVHRAREKGFGERASFGVGDASVCPLPTTDRAMVFNALPHMASPARLVANVARSLAPDGRLTIAHDASRAVIDGGHSATPSAVSRGLMPATDLARIVAPWFDVDVELDGEIYVVSGTLRADAAASASADAAASASANAAAASFPDARGDL